jgi:hypothetical protein
MSNDPTPSLSGWQSDRLAVLLDALDGYGAVRRRAWILDLTGRI